MEIEKIVVQGDVVFLTKNSRTNKVDKERLLECFQIIDEWLNGENIMLGNFEFDKGISLTEEEREVAGGYVFEVKDTFIKKVGQEEFDKLMKKYL